MNIIYVGKLIQRKRLDYLLQALDSISDSLDFQLDVYGEGSERSYLEDVCEESINLKNKVKFHGNVSRSEVWTAMAASDVFCMPSVNETLGLVYLEAMACGCITVGSKGEGIDGIIKDSSFAS